MASEDRRLTRNNVFAPESELLLLCSRATLDDATKAHIAQLTKTGIDWKRFRRGAESHGLTGLAYWHLKSICKDNVPDEDMNAISEVFMSHVGRNVVLSSELVQLLDLFETNAIIAVPLKGPVLAERSYGSTALRASGDLDIFIPKETVPTAFRLMQERGYVPCQWRHRELDDQFLASEVFTRLCWEYTFVKQDEDIYVDLHWQLLDAEFLRISSNDLMTRVEKYDFQGRDVSLFNDELSLIFLCAHAAKHGWYRINWIIDIAQMLDRMSDANWDTLLSLARSAGAERMVLLGLYLTKSLPNHHLPAELDRRIAAEPEVTRLGDEIVNHILRETIASEWKELKKWSFFLSLKERWTERAQLLRQLISEPTLDEWLQRPLPDNQFWLYRFLRPLNLFTQHVPRIGPRLVTGGYDSNLNRKPGR